MLRFAVCLGASGSGACTGGGRPGWRNTGILDSKPAIVRGSLSKVVAWRKLANYDC